MGGISVRVTQVIALNLLIGNEPSHGKISQNIYWRRHGVDSKVALHPPARFPRSPKLQIRFFLLSRNKYTYWECLTTMQEVMGSHNAAAAFDFFFSIGSIMLIRRPNNVHQFHSSISQCDYYQVTQSTKDTLLLENINKWNHTDWNTTNKKIFNTLHRFGM